LIINRFSIIIIKLQSLTYLFCGANFLLFWGANKDAEIHGFSKRYFFVSDRHFFILSDMFLYRLLRVYCGPCSVDG